MSKWTKPLILAYVVALPLLTGACSQAKQDDHGATAARNPGSSGTKKAKALTNRPAKISVADGAKLYTEPNTKSVEIRMLQENTVVWVLDEATSGQHWYRLKTRSGTDGWSQGPVQFCSVQEAQHLIATDREALEDRLRELILEAAAKEVNTKNPHPLSDLVSKTITSPLTPDSEASNSYSVNVSCLMVGSFMKRSKFRLDLKVDLFLEVDKDLLASSDARIKGAAIVIDQATDQMPVGESIALLKFVMPLL